MTDAFVYEAIRTPRGKGREGGGLNGHTPIALVAHLIEQILARTGVEPDRIGDLLLGCVTQTGEQGANIAKVAAMASGLPDSVSGLTLNRYCTSGLDACHFGAMKVMTGVDELVLAGGVESMSRVPLLSDRASFYSGKPIGKGAPFVPMGLAADLVATLDGASRSECDDYAVRSHHRAARAQNEGRFARSIVPMSGGLERDECVRQDANVDRLAQFEPLFGPLATPQLQDLFKERYTQQGFDNGVKAIHHAANSPAIVDGASLVLLGTEKAGERWGLKPRARVRAMSNVSADPVLALTGGIVASETVVRQADLSPSDIDLVEFNESFASVSIKFERESPWDADQINVNGGALSMGHAMGATGASLLGTLLDELERQDLKRGVVAVSGAAGIGAATVVERM